MAEHIKISDIVPRIQYTADGVSTQFSFSFPIFNDKDIDVYVGDTAQSDGYTVFGVGESAGGSITFDAPPASGAVVTLTRSLSNSRTTDFQPSSEFRAKVLNDELDYQMAALQGVATEVSRAIRLSPTDGDETDLVLPVRHERAQRLLGFDAEGSVIATHGAGGGSVAVENEGSPVAGGVTTLNFVGSGITAADSGNGEVTIAVAGGAAPVESVFGRTGTVVAATNDYTWMQIDKSVSSLADLSVRSHDDLSEIGALTHAEIDAHAASSRIHVDHGAVALTAGSGLRGGGDLTAPRTFAVDIDSLSIDTSPNGAADYVMTHDADTGTLKKVRLDHLPGSGSGGGLAIEDEGGSVTSGVTTLNFAGSGVTAIRSGTGEVTVTVAGGSAPVDSVFGRTGAVVATANDYTWSQIDKTASSLADIASKSHDDLTDTGSLSHTQLEAKLTVLESKHLNGLDYGMVGDGSVSAGRFVGTDNTATFQAAIDAASTQGKALFLPAGRYVLTHQAGPHKARVVVPHSNPTTQRDIVVIGDPAGGTEIWLDHEPTEDLGGSGKYNWGVAVVGLEATEGVSISRDRDTYGLCQFERVTFRGLWSEAPVDPAYNQHPQWVNATRIENFERVRFRNCHAYDILGSGFYCLNNGATDFHDNHLERITSVALRAGNTPDVECINNFVCDTGDDALDCIIDDVSPEPNRSRHHIRGNTWHRAKGAVVLGANTVHYDNNTATLCDDSATIGLANTFDQGNAGSSGNSITNNKWFNPLSRYDSARAAWLSRGQDFPCLNIAGQVLASRDTTTVPWTPSRSYTTGSVRRDPVDNTIWIARDAHTGDATMMANDRGAHWRMHKVPERYLNATEGVLAPEGYVTKGATLPVAGFLSGTDMDDTQTSVPAQVCVISGNEFAWTLAPATTYSDWKTGDGVRDDRYFTPEGWVDPAGPDIGDAQKQRISTAMIMRSFARDYKIANNIVRNFEIGLLFFERSSSDFDDLEFVRVAVDGNIFTDVRQAITTNRKGAASDKYWDISCRHNDIDGDPWLKDALRNGFNGTWNQSFDTNRPTGINFKNVVGPRCIGNTFANLYRAIEADETKIIVRDNILKCEPTFAVDSVANKGIRWLLKAGAAYRYEIWGSDPTNHSNWGRLLNVCLDEFAAKPKSGFYVQGHFVRNTRPTLGGGRATTGWLRLTTGSDHASGADWAPCFSDATGGSGEANTASNKGIGGVGVFDQKSGIDLQFRSIRARSSNISVSLDATNKRIDLDVSPTNLVGALAGESNPDIGNDFALVQDVSAGVAKKVRLQSLHRLALHNTDQDFLTIDRASGYINSLVRLTSNNPQTVSLSDDFEVGDSVLLRQAGTGTIEVIAPTGGSLNGAPAWAQHREHRFTCVDTTGGAREFDVTPGA